MKTIITAAALALAALLLVTGPASASPAQDGPRCRHVSIYHATGHLSLRGLLRTRQVHAGLPGLLATSYTCGGGWTPDWSAYLLKVNGKQGTGALLPRGMRVWYVGAGPRA